jgi:hypothetical protein
MFERANGRHPTDLRAHNAETLLRRLFRDVASLARMETRLAQTELTSKAAVAKSALGLLSLSAASGVVAALCAAAALVMLLGPLVGYWVVLLVLALAFASAAFAFSARAHRSVACAGGLLPSATAAQIFGAPDSSHKPLTEQEAEIAWTRRQIDESIVSLENKTDLVPSVRNSALSLGSLSMAVAAIVRQKDDPARP